MLFAKEFAKATLCIGQDKPCGKCEACISFKGNNNPDIKIIDEKEKTIKTEIIKQMVKSAYEKPIKSAKKTYIINDSDKMTKEAQNSLLKTLEEPPEYVVIILISENENLLLNTIKSRCTKIKFNILSKVQVEQVLKEKFGFVEVSDNLLELAEGSVEKAIWAQGKEDYFAEIKQIFTNIEKSNIIDLLNKKDTVFKNKDEIEEILSYINLVLFNKIQENKKYLNGIKIVEETKNRLKKNSNYDMSIDNMLYKLWEEING